MGFLLYKTPRNARQCWCPAYFFLIWVIHLFPQSVVHKGIDEQIRTLNFVELNVDILIVSHEQHNREQHLQIQMK
jgi:hypothetical protein